MSHNHHHNDADADDVVEFEMERMHRAGDKRKLFDDNDNDNNDLVGTDEVMSAISAAKRLKLSPVKKRMSAGSTNSDTSSVVSSVSPKPIGKVVTGQLVMKNMYCVNNEANYLFKFLVENESKNYYGNASQYQQLNVDERYTIESIYNGRICLGKVTPCKSKEKLVVAKQFVQQSDFDGEDTVSVVAKFKFGFRVLDTNLYKAVFVMNYGESMENSYQVQIECQATLTRWASAIKDETIGSESELLAYFADAQNSMVNLWRVKCQQSNGNYKNLRIQEITQMERTDKPSIVIENDDYNDNIVSVSRSNKRVLDGIVHKIRAERQSDKCFSITYVLRDFKDKPVRGSFFVNSKQNDSKQKTDKTNDRMELFESDINQLDSIIEMEFIRVHIYVAADLQMPNYNVLGITKFEYDNNTYKGM
ncbi:LEF-3 [Alphabaculovirus myunipunctae]|uniref:LEF-3 n=1 Tax=Mythimna unipuncta nucleopolyhedrovirus TaxID=447897 RepID=A0A2K9VSC5_9ABAC|nr:LEF-3 [Mythimna unipuncta nucleopolyhedrovirus]AUV65365.1 LEF-3 [Mythimna unipuncta nucleopolyhedrovirus]